MRAGILVLSALLAATAGCLNTFEEPAEPHFVRILSLELSPAHVFAQDLLLNVTAYLDNRGGGETGALRLHAKAFDDANGFLIAETQALVGVLPGETTRPVPMQLEVPRKGGVRIDVVLFEDDLGLQTASTTARNLAALEPEVLDTGLRISDVDFLVRSVAGGANGTAARATIETNLYVTNEGSAPSEDLRLQVSAVDVATSLVLDMGWVDTGSVPAGATHIRSLALTVPEGKNYRFEIVTWRGSAIVARSEGIVQLAPTYVKPADQEVVTDTPNIRDFLTNSPTQPGSSGGRFEGSGNSMGASPAEPNVPGFGTAALVLAALAASSVILLRRRRAP